MSQTALIRFFCPAAVIGAALLLTSCNGGDQPTPDETSPPAVVDKSSISAPDSAAPDAPEGFTWPETPPGLPQGAPLISFVKMRHEFGAITDAGTYIGSFPFKNIGTGTLVIRDIRTTCGCTVPELEKREYLPGEEGTLEVVFDPSNRKEGFIKYLFLLSNSAALGQAKLSVTADITPLMRFDSIFLRVGAMELGKSHEHTFNTYYTDSDLKITRVEVDNPHVTVRLLSQSRLPQPGADGQYEYRAIFEMTIAQTAPWGTLDPGKITIAARAGQPGAEPHEAIYTMFISGQLFGDLSADPTAISSEESLRVGDSFEGSAILSSISGSYFSVVEASLAEPSEHDIEVIVEPINPSSYRISVRCTARVKGPMSGRVRVLTDVPGEEELLLGYFSYVK
ncbi:MAG: DUF1573 domain-containing protein [Planctomycetota bacterium]